MTKEQRVRAHARGPKATARHELRDDDEKGKRGETTTTSTQKVTKKLRVRAHAPVLQGPARHELRDDDERLAADTGPHEEDQVGMPQVRHH